MPIRPYLDDHQFDGETVRAMGIAFEMTRAALDRGPRADLPPEIVAAEIIEVAKAGERDPNRLCERALLVLRP